MKKKQQSQQEPKDMASWRPGSEPEAAKDVGAARDFGAPAEKSAERDYASANTKRADPGATQPFAWEHDGVRDHGAGARDSGPGSASGGDLDTDLVGTGGGISINGPGDAPGPDDTDGTSNVMAARPDRPEMRARNEKVVDHFTEADVMTRDTDIDSAITGQGADAATSPTRDDDSFAGEISSSEVSGENDAQ